MILIDSSAWIAFFKGDAAASAIEKYLNKAVQILVPSLVIYEVYRHLTRKLSREEALYYVTQLQAGTILNLDEDLALFAAETSLQHKLAMADAIIYSSALTHDATLVTLDNDFRNLPQCIIVNSS